MVRTRSAEATAKATRKKPTPRKTAPTTAVKKPHRWRAGTLALREIKKYQRSTNHLIPKGVFYRLARQILVEEIGREDMRLAKDAVLAMQEATEAYLAGLFELTNALAIHRSAVTIAPKDMHLALIARGELPMPIHTEWRAK